MGKIIPRFCLLKEPTYIFQKAGNGIFTSPFVELGNNKYLDFCFQFSSYQEDQGHFRIKAKKINSEETVYIPFSFRTYNEDVTNEIYEAGFGEEGGTTMLTGFGAGLIRINAKALAAVYAESVAMELTYVPLEITDDQGNPATTTGENFIFSLTAILYESRYSETILALGR